MKKLLNSLFVTTENCYLSLENQNVIISKNKEKIAQFPLHTLESIISFSFSGASPSLMGECAKRKINLCFMDHNGKFLARVCGESYGNVYLRKNQYKISENQKESCIIARNMILAKVYNCKQVINRVIRDNKLRIDEAKLKAVSNHLSEYFPSIRNTVTLDTLRGIEGECAQQYFSIFNDFILNQKESFSFNSRSRRPPLDKVNALLSFGYSLLASECASALESVGLDSYIGFMHADRPGRKSLALDLMEELRPHVIDKFILSLINLKVVNDKHFITLDSGAVYLNDDGRKIFISNYQKRKQEMINHPYLNEKIEWGLVPYSQALLLARYLREDLDEYPPFMWK